MQHVQGNMRGPRGVGQLWDFLAILVPIPWKSQSYEASMLGHYRTASVTPFKWRFVGEPMMARFKFSDNWVLSPPHQLKYVVKA